MTPSPAVADAIGRLLHIYGKAHVVFVATGTLALEVSLRSVGVRPGDIVVVPDHCCYLVPASVMRVGAIPVFAAVTRRLVLEPVSIPEELCAVAKAIIAVHTYGLPCDIGALRQRLGATCTIIEDASLAFDIRIQGAPIGRYSDVVVTSLGAHKPLSLKEGGAVFSDDPAIGKLIERYGDEARQSPVPPMPYALSPYALSYLPKAILRAERVVRRQRSLANIVIPRLLSLGFIPWQANPGDRPTWHRIPVWIPSGKLRAIATDASLTGHVVQTPHTIPVPQLPMFRHARYFNTGYDAIDAESLLLLRVDSREAMERWLERLVDVVPSARRSGEDEN